MKNRLFLLCFLFYTPVFAQSSGIPWRNGEVLTANKLQSLDAAKMNVSSLGKRGFAPKLNDNGQITAPVVGDVSGATATSDGKTVSQIGQKAVGSVQQTDANQPNGYAKLDENQNVTSPLLNNTRVGGSDTGTDISNALVNNAGTTDNVVNWLGKKVDVTGGTSTGQTLNSPSISSGMAVGLEVSNAIGTVFGASVSRYIKAKLLDVVSVKDFGAKGDGSTDDTAAIQAAITYMLSTSNSGGTVFFPDGHYSVSSPLIIGGSGITLLGHSPNAAQLITSSTTENIVEIGSGSSINEGDRIIGLGFSAEHAQTAGAAIYSHGAVNLIIDNIRVIENVYNGIVLDSDGSSTMGVFISNFDLKLILNSGITIGPTTGITDILIQNGIIRPGSIYPYDGIHIIQGYGVYIQNIDITNFGSFYFTHAIEIAPGTGQQSNAILLTQVLCDNSSEENMTLGGSGNISDIQAVGSWFSTSAKGPGISFENKNTDGVTIDSSTIDSNCTYGILLDKGKNIGISGNKLFANSKCGTTSVSYDGVYVAAGISHFSVTNNQIGSGGYFNTISAGGVANYGVFVAAGASDDYIISLNRGFGNTSGIVYDGGTGANKYVAGNITGTP